MIAILKTPGLLESGAGFGRWPIHVLLLLGLLSHSPASAQTSTNAVTGGNNINYTINGMSDPTLTLQRGVLYVFSFSNIGSHPFWIKSSLGGGSAGRYDVGVTNNGFQSGALFFRVATNAPNQLFYQCGAHSSMAGTLNIITPAAPTPSIVFVNIASFITVRFTGTNAWRAVPEFKCGLTAPDWSPVASFTNAYATGTNTTTFSRLDSICGASNVFLRIRNQTN